MQLSGQLHGVGRASFFVVTPAKRFGSVGLTAVLVAPGQITSGTGFAFPVQWSIPSPGHLSIGLFGSKSWKVKLVPVQQTETNRDHGDQQWNTDQPHQQRFCVGQRNCEWVGKRIDRLICLNRTSSKKEEAWRTAEKTMIVQIKMKSAKNFIRLYSTALPTAPVSRSFGLRSAYEIDL